MGGDRSVVVAPSVAPLGVGVGVAEREQGHLSSFDSSVYAVSFGFVATVVLILMFLVMAIFERFLRPRSSAAGRNSRDLESQMMFHGKPDYPSPKVCSFSVTV